MTFPEAQFPEQRLRMACGASSRRGPLTHAQVHELLSASVRVHEARLIHVAADHGVMALWHEEAKRETAEHHLDRRLPRALLRLYGNEFGDEQEVLLRNPEVFTD